MKTVLLTFLFLVVGCVAPAGQEKALPVALTKPLAPRSQTLNLTLTDAGGTPAAFTTNCALPEGEGLVTLEFGQVIASWVGDVPLVIRTRHGGWDLSSGAGPSPRLLNLTGKSLDPRSEDHPLIMVTTEGTDMALRQAVNLTIHTLLAPDAELSFQPGSCNRPSPIPQITGG